MLFIIGERRPTQTIRVLLILIGYLYINVVKVFFVSGIDGESESLGVAKGSGQDGLMGGTKEATIHLEGTEGEVDCKVCGVPVVCIQEVGCVGTLELDKDQAHYVS